jgi:hypothetical protein
MVKLDSEELICILKQWKKSYKLIKKGERKTRKAEIGKGQKESEIEEKKPMISNLKI